MYNKGDRGFLVETDERDNVVKIHHAVVQSVTAKQMTINGDKFLRNGECKNKANLRFSTESGLLEMKTALDRDADILHARRRYFYKNTPTRQFSIGDEVLVGVASSKIYTVVWVSEDQLIYEIEGPSNKKIVPWFVITKASLTSDNDIYNRKRILLDFANQKISSLFHYMYCYKMNFNPSYQRGEEWTLKDKELLIDSMFRGIDIGKIVLCYTQEDNTFEVLDGKQRMLALMEFYEDGFKYKNRIYSELSLKDKTMFSDANITIGIADNLTELQKEEYFYILNRGGKAVSSEHLENILSSIYEKK